jgi:hypothetical protein
MRRLPPPVVDLTPSAHPLDPSLTTRPVTYVSHPTSLRGVCGRPLTGRRPQRVCSPRCRTAGRRSRQIAASRATSPQPTESVSPALAVGVLPDYPSQRPAPKAPFSPLQVLQLLAPPYRYRVTRDAEGWPVIPGRYGRLEWHDGTALAVYTDRPRVFACLWAVPGSGAGRSAIRRPGAWCCSNACLRSPA